MPFKSKAKLKAYNKRRDATAARRRARSLNVLARRKMAKQHGKAAIRGKDVDHVKPISKGGTNALSNLRIRSKRKNSAVRSNTKKR